MIYQAARRLGGILKCILLQKKCQSEKATYCGHDSNYMTFWEDEMVRRHHQLNGHESEQPPGDSEGWGSLMCCSPWGHKESDTT